MNGSIFQNFPKLGQKLAQVKKKIEKSCDFAQNWAKNWAGRYIDVSLFLKNWYLYGSLFEAAHPYQNQNLSIPHGVTN